MVWDLWFYDWGFGIGLKPGIMIIFIAQDILIKADENPWGIKKPISIQSGRYIARYRAKPRK